MNSLITLVLHCSGIITQLNGILTAGYMQNLQRRKLVMKNIRKVRDVKIVEQNNE